MIRDATLADIDALVDLARFFVPKVGAATLSEKRFRPEICKLIKSESAIVLIAEHEGDVVGGLVGQIGRVWYSDDLYATDLAFVVRAEYSGLYAWLLAKKFIRWAKSDERVVEVTMQISSGMGDVERVGRLYESLGLANMGGCYTMRVRS